MIDDGHAVHYTAVERGTPVFSSDEVEVGTVDQVVDNYKEHIFDGIVMRTTSGDYRFVDAPEVKRTAEKAVTLTITAALVDELPPPEQGGFAEFEPRRRAGKIASKLGMGWRKKK
jgi:hypothetical protein